MTRPIYIVPEWATYLRFRPLFAEAMDPRFYTLDWLDQQVLTGSVKFWASHKAGLITEIRTYPTGAQDIHVLIAAGDADEIVNVLRPRAEAWAVMAGMVGAIVESRPGWERALKPCGYEPYQRAVRKDFCRGAA